MQRSTRRGGNAPEGTAILDDLRRIVRVLRESSRSAEQRLGVSGAQLFVMRTLATEPALSLNALAARTRTHQSTVSVVIKRLAAAGIVHRRPSRLDGRRVELELTLRGRKLLARAPLAAQDRLIAGVDALPAPRRRALAASLASLVVSMQIGTDEPSMFFEEQSSAHVARRKGSRRRGA
jgi:DNA-binding MarR family transcriptional regulator